MSRCIDANKLIEFINSKFVVSWKHDYDGGFKDACVEILNAIEDAPTIDIVRCGECKHWRAYETWSECERWTDDPYESAKTKADDFCSYGEREGE